MKRNSISNKIMAITVLSSLSITALTGCSLFPSEDVSRSVPTVIAEEIDYKLTVVTRTNVTNAKTFYCNYSETDSIDLSFETGGKKYGDVYVSKGAKVAAGDLLATLEMGSLEKDIESLEESISAHEEALAQSNELMNLEINKVNTQYKYGLISATQKESELSKIESSYASTNKKLTETLYLEHLEYDTLITKLNNYSIYAPIDGVITYVSSEMKNSSKTSVQGKTMISITSASECVFQARTALTSYYKDGDIVTINMTKGGTGTYDAVIALSPDDDELMYLYPTEEITDLEIGARAIITLVIDSRENVLAVESTAIHKAADFKYVYYINKDGIRDMKIVETGLTGGGLTEIVSGLEFGETIIN